MLVDNAKKQLKSTALKRALSAYLVDPLVSKYNIASLRVLQQKIMNCGL